MAGLSWLSIFRLGLVQTALGAMFVLTTSTMNRVMTVELALAASLPGALSVVHHVIQFARPKWGYHSDVGGRRTPWILGGLAVLGTGVFLAAVATMLMSVSVGQGIVLAVFAYVLIGVGVGAAGTSVLAMLASKVAPNRRAPAATMAFLMMIAGFIVTAGTVEHLLKPFSLMRLVVVTGGVVVVAFLVAVAASWGVERSASEVVVEDDLSAGEKPPFFLALREVWAEPKARAFTIFVLLSMTAYGAQELILEPFAGFAFGMDPAETTGLSRQQNQGVFVGMLFVAIAVSGSAGPRLGSVRLWTVLGCAGSGVALGMLVLSGYSPSWPIEQTVLALGLANGAFAAGAIGWMMMLASDGRASREGIRMGLYGAAQAIGMAFGGFVGTLGVDIVRLVFDTRVLSYAAVFGAEGALFLFCAVYATRLQLASADRSNQVVATTEPAPAMGAAGLSR